MKKFFAVLLVLVMVFTLAACGESGGSESEGSTESSGVDMSAYPADVNEWTGQNYIDYFKAVGLFTDDNAHETWLQDHANYWPETPVSECAGWWDNEGIEGCMMILILDPGLADSSQEDFDAWMTSIRDDKNLPGDYSSLGVVDHLIGNVAFSYSAMTLDDECLAACDAAFDQFVADTGATPEF